MYNYISLNKRNLLQKEVQPMAIHFNSLSRQEQEMWIKTAIPYWNPRRLLDYSPTELDSMSGYNVAGKVIENTKEKLLLEIEDNPYVIPADLDERFRIIEGIHQRTMWESPYAQKLKFGHDDFYCVASAGAAIILQDLKGNLGLLSTFRVAPENISYAGSWNITIGAARYNSKEDGLGEHTDLISTTKRRVLHDYGLINKRYNKLIIPRVYANALVPEEKMELIELAAKKIKGMYCGRNKPPTDIELADSDFLRLVGEKEIQIQHNGKVYVRKMALPVFGEYLHDLNLVKAIKITVSSFEDIIPYDLQENAKTGESLNKMIAIFRLDPNSYRPVLNQYGEPVIIIAFQSGVMVDFGKMPKSIVPVPSLKAVFGSLQNKSSSF